MRLYANLNHMHLIDPAKTWCCDAALQHGQTGMGVRSGECDSDRKRSGGRASTQRLSPATTDVVEATR